MGRIMIAGSESGCGKTTVTCAILLALKKRGTDVSSFKCGPDYIDPAFQREILGIKSYNLDTFMMRRNTVKYLLNKHSRGVAVIDGIKGYYDGLNFTTTASSYEMSAITETPTVLVVDCNGMGTSAAALIGGFLKYKKNKIAGVIFNRLRSVRYKELKRLCELHRIRCFGYLPPMRAVAVENKNLALVTRFEIDDKKKQMNAVSEQAEKSIDLDALIALSETAKSVKNRPIEIPRVGRARIAVSHDKAFCFNYDDNLELLEEMGAELVGFSPLEDKALPEDIGGLILTGGYPELFGAELEANVSMREAVREAVTRGIPTIAVAGGFLYLHETMHDIRGVSCKMAGALKGDCVRSEVPQADNGYITIKSDRDSLLFDGGDTINTYEFHRYESSNPGSDLTVSKSGKEWKRIHSTETLFSGFPHVHFYSNIDMAKRYIQACANGQSAQK